MALSGFISSWLKMKSRKPSNLNQPPNLKQRALASTEADLWKSYTETVKPLPLNKKNMTQKPATASDQEGARDVPRRKQKLDHPPSLNSAAKPSPDFDHGKGPGLERRDKANLRRGRVTIEGRLDLHGMTQAEAHRRLFAFLARARDDGRRTVLVITGKGSRLEGGEGVLRRAVPRWLNEAPVRDWIKGFSYAARQHGGEGALYVLLKRRRP